MKKILGGTIVLALLGMTAMGLTQNDPPTPPATQTATLSPTPYPTQTPGGYAGPPRSGLRARINMTPTASPLPTFNPGNNDSTGLSTSTPTGNNNSTPTPGNGNGNSAGTY
jgi:hypothetical protein